MELKKLDNNTHALSLAGKTLLFSYETLVAVHISGTTKYYATSMKYSKTTTRSINEFCINPIYVSQSELESMAIH